jgi:hypothetical protein
MALLPPIGLREVSEGLYGATRLAKGDAHGIQFFGDTPEAFWKSFWAAAIAAPLHALLLAIELGGAHVAASGLRVLLVETIAYVVLWTAFPLAMYSVAKVIDREELYIRFICAANWSFVLQAAFSLFMEASIAIDILPSIVANGLAVVTLAALLLYSWFIARVGLELSRLGAAGIVALDVMISLIINRIVHAML